MTPWMAADFTKNFPGISIRGEFTWHDRPRRVTALFGPSGCGKTTILRCLAGLERPDSGSIQFQNESWCDVARGVHVPPQQRRVGFLFQDYMLFPHLSVHENIAFGAARSASAKAEVERLLERFQLGGLGHRRPRELSGGQQQRVALTRVLAAQPRLLCLDEPLSALDVPTRTELRLALRDWLHEVQLPALIVSHDPVEVQVLADDVIVLSEGRARQAGSVEHVWQHPVDVSVARIVGYDNLLPVKVIDVSGSEARVAHAGWQVGGSSQAQLKPGDEACLCVRAEDVLVAVNDEIDTDPQAVVASLVEIIPEAGRWRARLKLPTGTILQSIVTRPMLEQLESGRRDGIRVTVTPRAGVVVAAD